MTADLPWARVLVLCAIQFVDVLSVTVTVTTLPAMLSDLHASASIGGLVATGYAMFFGGLLVVGARLGDRFGHRRMLLCGIVVFGLGAFAAAVAPTVAVLIAARCVQGAAAAVSIPTALTLLTMAGPDGPARDRAVASWSAAGAAAGAAGFVVGGLVGQLAGWRWIFAGLVVLAGVLLVAVARSVPPTTGPLVLASRVNARAGVLFTAAVMGLVIALSLVGQPGHGGLVVTLLALAVVFAGLFATVDRSGPAPLLPGRMLTEPNVRAGALASFVNTATTSSAVTLVTLYLQDHLGRSPLLTAATLLPFSLLVVAGSGLAARLLARVGPNPVIGIGLVAIAASDAVLCLTADRAVGLAVCVALSGAGIGLSSVAATRRGTSVAVADRGSASGLINTAAQLGTAVGIAVLVLVAAVTDRTPGPDVPPPTAAWLAAAGFALLAGLSFLRPPRRARTSVSDPVSTGR